MSVDLLSSDTVQNPDRGDKIIDALRRVFPFSELPEKVIATIADQADFRVCDIGETVLAAGQFDGSIFYVICNGNLKATKLDEHTGEMQMRTFAAGTIFGLAASVVEAHSITYDHMSLTASVHDTQLIIVEAERFRELVAQRPTLARILMQYFASEIIELEMGTSKADTSSSARIYEQLLRLVTRDDVSDIWRIEKMPKHRELADMAGVAEAEAAAAIAEIIQDGVVRRDYPGLVIEDMARLSHLST